MKALQRGMIRLALLAFTAFSLTGVSHLANRSLTRADARESVQQQGGNLLANADMNGVFTARDGKAGIPQGWDLFINWGNPDSYQNNGFPHVRSNPTSWAIRGDQGYWEAGGYQTVTVTPGTIYRFVAHVFVFTCDDPLNFCRDANGARSDQSIGSQVRVGIDPTGGRVAANPSVVWGPWSTAYDQFTGLSVDVAAQNAQITVFFMATSARPATFNESYWDDFSLTAVGQGSANPIQPPANTTGGSNPAPAQPAAPNNFAPYVRPQQARTDGSVIHVVQGGDTINTILFAYRDLGVTRDSLMEINGWRWEPRIIYEGDEIIILPPGSVDPATGRVLNPTASGTPAGGAVVSTPTPGGAAGGAIVTTPTPGGSRVTATPRPTLDPTALWLSEVNPAPTATATP